jgi:MFS superfamily sulfate permease-like transporter
MRWSRDSKFKSAIKDMCGAFADGGILFPLLIILTFQGAFSGPKLFASAGIAYLVSAWIFKIPMPVQPLKSIAIAAIAIGASNIEIRISGFLLGIFCLLITFTNVNALAKKVPASIVHSVQLGLGVLLFTQGLGVLSLVSPIMMAVSAGIFGIICIFSSLSLLGFLAAGGIIAGLIFPSIVSTPALHSAITSSSLRVITILSLILPQMALTLTNSVVATADVAKRYYGDRAKHVTERNLLLSVGAGNIISSLFGGLPYCHGSGGMTAHYRGGSTTVLSNIVIGAFLLGVAAFAFASGRIIAIGYPNFLLASLLMAVGFFHLGLAKTTWVTAKGKIQLIASGGAAILTHNMLVVLGVSVLCQGLFHFLYYSPTEVESL